MLALCDPLYRVIQFLFQFAVGQNPADISVMLGKAGTAGDRAETVFVLCDNQTVV